MSLAFDASPVVLIDEHREISQLLAEGMRLAVADAAASAHADEAAAPGTCVHCGGTTAPGAALCDDCGSGHDDCQECGPLDEDGEP